MRRYYNILPFVISAALLLVLYSPHLFFTIGDSENMLNIAVSIYELGDLSLNVQRNIDTGEIVRNFSKYGLGLPFVMAAMLALSDLFHTVLGTFKTSVLLSLTNIGIIALTAQAVSSILTTLGFSRRRALFLSLAAIFGTFAFPYANLFFSEPLQGLCLTAALASALLAFRENSNKTAYLAASALLLSYAVFTKGAALIVVPLFIVYIFYKARESEAPLAKTLLSFLVPLAIGGAVVGFFNYTRFGSPFEFGYLDETGLFTNPMGEGIRNLLVNPNKGLLLFAPIMFLFPVALWRFARRARAEARLIGSAFVVNFILYSTWWAWEGGECWGPRFILPLMPLALVSFAPLLDKAALKVIVVLLLFIGFLFNLLFSMQDLTGFNYLVFRSTERIELATPRPTSDYIKTGGYLQTPPHVVSSYIPQFSAPVGHLWLLRARLEGRSGGYGLGEENLVFARAPWQGSYPAPMADIYKGLPTEVKARVNCPPPLWLSSFICPVAGPTAPYYYDALMAQAAKGEALGLAGDAARMREKATKEAGEKERRQKQMRSTEF